MKNLEERTAKGLHDSLIKKLTDKRFLSGEILDLGCGTGAWMKRMLDSGCEHVEGIELMPVVNEQNQSLAIHQGDINSKEWPVKDKRYHLITTTGVIEHLSNIELFLVNVERHLADEDMFVLITPNIYSLAGRVRFLLLDGLRQFDSKGDPTYLFPVVLDTLPRVLERAGLHVTEVWSYPENCRAVNARPFVNVVTGLLRPFLMERVGMGVLCMAIKKIRPS
jgi:2-polyprenyl-3-methyl-5-hydroxy-6-metoxy-1,4-benzoquinol methylase